MKILLLNLLTVACLSGSVVAQDTTYFDNSNEKVAKSSADYCRVQQKQNDSILVKEYYKSGQIKMEGTYLSLKPEVKTGDFKYYHQSGSINQECTYVNNMLNGNVTNYDQNNNIKSKYFYKDGIATDTLIKENNATIITGSPDNGAADVIFTIVEKMPEFPGGQNAKNQFLKRNIRYPGDARENNITGPVYLGFVVKKDGTLSDVKVLKGIGYGCNEEALRVIKLMPKWIPGTQNGKPVNVSLNMPVYFNLR